MSRRKRKTEPESEPQVVEYDLDAIEAELDAKEAAEAAEQGTDQPGSEEAEKLRAELDELRDRYQRALADYQNFQRRSRTNEIEARESGVRCVVEDLLTVLDHFDLALNQDFSSVTAEQLAQGVKVIRDELFRALERRGVAVVAPEPNDEFEPGQHEAVMQQPADGVDPGRVAVMVQVGYRLGQRVVRPAKVAVSPPEPDDEPAPTKDEENGDD